MSRASGRLVVTSYMPGSEYWDPRWPESGPAGYEETIGRLPKPELILVLELPVRNPGHLHFQRGAHWVVLEIEGTDPEPRSDGSVLFRQGVVRFKGPAPAAREYLVAHGHPAPSSLSVPQTVADWSTGSAEADAIILGGSEVDLRAGDHSLAYAVSGSVRAGHHGIAVSACGRVEAGDDGVAATYGRSATAGDRGVATCPEFGTATSGKLGVAVTNTGGLAVAGERGVAVGMLNGNATAGPEGIALACEGIAGNGGTAKAGIAGIALAIGEGATSQAGEGGVVILIRSENGRLRAHVSHVGEDGILPDIAYTLDEQGHLVRAKSGL